MVKLFNGIIQAFFLSLIALTVMADDAVVAVPMQAKSGGTYYIKAGFGNGVSHELMLDTGSEYLVINEHTLKLLSDQSQAKYLNDITGVLANGTELKVPVYRLASVTIGSCVVRDTAAAVFPGNTREILGLTVLRKIAAFSVSLDPAVLTLHNCDIDPATPQTAATSLTPDHTDNLSGLPEIASMVKN